MRITVFTPTYNRAHCLEELYGSLCKQSFKDFEWIVVDDGSEDSTCELVSSWLPQGRRDGKNGFMGITNKGITLFYFYQQNGGKHRAINRGVREAHGEVFFIVDSDDALPVTSLETINRYWQQVKDKCIFGGIAGFMSHRDGKIIGKGEVYGMLDCNALEFRYKHKVFGDMAEVFRTSVLKDNPFPEFDDERFCPEALVWNRIAQTYKLRYFQEIVYFRDYLDGGLTDRIVSIRMNSPQASLTHYQELSTYRIPFVQKIKAAINYWRFWFCLKENRNIPKLALFWYLLKPCGWLLHKIDLK